MRGRLLFGSGRGRRHGEAVCRDAAVRDRVSTKEGRARRPGKDPPLRRIYAGATERQNAGGMGADDPPVEMPAHRPANETAIPS